MIIIGTHLDTVPKSQQEKKESYLRSLIQNLYVDYSHSVYCYPTIKEIFFVDCHKKKYMDRLRHYIYNFVSAYKPPDSGCV